MSGDFDTHADQAVSLANSPRHTSILDLIAANETRRFLDQWQAQVDAPATDNAAAELTRLEAFLDDDTNEGDRRER